MILEEIRRPIESELAKVEIEFQKSINSNVELIDKIVNHVVTHKGKRLRPIFLLLASAMVGGITNDSIKAAAIIELLHTATLIHDDVVDEADLRRGGPSINSIWDNKTSILIGDFIFSSVLHNLSDLKNFKMIEVISSVAKRMSQGELLQMQHGHDYDIEETTYFRLISEKTASLLAATCKLGAITSINGNDDSKIEVLNNFGQYLGLAFQIKDDLLDFTGNEKTLGKPVTNDLLENIVTLPLLYGLKNSTNSNHEKIAAVIKRGIQEKDIDTIVTFARESGGIEYATKKADEFKNKALNCLEHFEDSLYKKALRKLAEFITSREH